MAELQWIIEVRCINNLLAEVKVGERGEYFIVDIPDKDFLPSELNKLIKAFEMASEINEENRKNQKQSKTKEESPKLSEKNDIIEKRNFARMNILSTGELVNINIPERLLAPSEAHELIRDLKAVKQKMQSLRITN